jgi:hypothetical protein
MRIYRTALLTACLAQSVAGVVFGQTAIAQPPAATATQPNLVEPPAWLYNDLACAPVLTMQAPPAVRVLGSQDTVVKRMLGPGDTLVVSGGSAAGLQPGQLFFVRRNIKTFGAKGPDAEHPVHVHTAAWVKILGVDAGVATASVVHACEGILLDDYLDPFTAPMIAARPAPGSVPQYANMGRITTGDENIRNVGTGQMIGIDRGNKEGVFLGERFLVFRDKRSMRNESRDYSEPYVQNAHRLPLVEVAEVLVVSVRPDDATVQVTMAKDSVSTGDFIAEIR